MTNEGDMTDKLLMAGGAIAVAIIGALWFHAVSVSDDDMLQRGECMVKFQRERNVTPEVAWNLCEGR